MADALERITLTHLQVPLKEPFRISGGEVSIKDAILVTIETPSAIGIGESSPWPSGSATRPTRPRGAGTTLPSGSCRGSSAARSRPSRTSPPFPPSGPASRFAIAGVETALWDLVGQTRHAPIAELLGASVEQIDRGVESGLAVGLYPTIVELLKVIENHLAEGYRRVKIKIAPGHDVELVRAVRQHFGDIELMVDANGAYTIDDIDIFRTLDEYDLLMFEQPLAADDLDGLSALQAAVTTPVCLDETAETPERTAEAIRRGACRIVNIKIQRVGGFGPALALHDLCYEKGVACWVGTMPELGVGQAQGIHLAALANCKYPTDIEPSARWFVDDYVIPLIELSAPGILRVPTRPGLGYQVDPAKVRRYQVQHREFTARTVG